MLCPTCRAGCLEGDFYCRRCGTDLSIPSTSLVPVRKSLPTVLQNPQVPRIAAGVGALAVGVGIELLRRVLLARMTRPVRATGAGLPAISGLKEMLAPMPAKNSRKIKLPKGYEIHETLVYMQRVIRRED